MWAFLIRNLPFRRRGEACNDDLVLKTFEGAAFLLWVILTLVSLTGISFAQAAFRAIIRSASPSTVNLADRILKTCR